MRGSTINCCGCRRWSPTMAASVISPALLFRLVILISLPSGAVKDVQVIQGIVQLVYKILDKYLDELVAGGCNSNGSGCILF